MRPAKPPPRPIRAVAGILERDGRILLGKRPPGLLGGLWEPVTADLDDTEEGPAALVRGFSAKVGLDVQIGKPLGSVLHVFTHRRLVLEVFEVHAPNTEEPRRIVGYEGLRWVDPQGPDVALSTLARKTLALVPHRPSTVPGA